MTASTSNLFREPSGLTLRYTTEASILGFPPGCYPAQFYTDDGRHFHLAAVTEAGAQYHQTDGAASIFVFND